MAKPEGSAEDRLIARYFRPLATHPGALGLADDAAILVPPPGCDLVLKADAIIGGVHFFPDDPAGAVGRKALRVNLSDLAAKGAKPVGFLLSLALPAGTPDAWLADFADGLRADAQFYGCPLFGGDTDRTPGPVMVSIAAFGTVPHGSMVRRSGAKPGDCVFVSGTIGDAALGVKLRREPALAARYQLEPRERDHLLARYLIPEPRVDLSEQIRLQASAAMDVSDGLAGDLAKLCAASGVSADVEIEQVPLSDAARRVVAVDEHARELAVTGGDDYEVVCTIAAENREAFRAAALASGVAVTEIGRIVAGRAAPRFRDRHGHPLEFAHPSFSHF
ncbi:MAG TPA: thiamine-phosphate kinase [Xanthobacteraceae bacterium]